MRNRELETVLAEALAALEQGANVEPLLARRPALAPQLHPPLAIWQELRGRTAGEPSLTAAASGEQRLHAALERGTAPIRPLPAPPFRLPLSRAAAFVSAGVLFSIGTVGAAAAGGPNLPAAVLSAFGFNSEAPEQSTTAVESSAAATPTPAATPTGSGAQSAATDADDERPADAATDNPHAAASGSDERDGRAQPSAAAAPAPTSTSTGTPTPSPQQRVQEALSRPSSRSEEAVGTERPDLPASTARPEREEKPKQRSSARDRDRGDDDDDDDDDD